ncbi:hypothetical protein AOQ84DRAFT_402945 [Glonium stellatum]|uniref:Uncharacterized protein n=1 Tax=Glonium stellatum TaxID=574774 RepID=A0A8E2F439_9PEZI|nr:hypothetical protein AOQ84DRAFT_402945 [Glonium stellatum]
MAEDAQPIIVGIDLGLTCTGVAFYPSGEDTTVAVISEWPGSDDKVIKKVPTSLYYSAGNRHPKKWGFECPGPGSTEQGMRVKDRFKLYLVEEFFQRTFGGLGDCAPGNFEDVQMWFEDFLTLLYKEIEKCVSKRLKLDDWRATKVEYLFSVPTTWDDHLGVLDIFKAIATRAGFGESEEHSIEVSLNEAEAAAVYTAASQKHRHSVGILNHNACSADASSRLREGDTILVCDIGGGTTDVAVLKVTTIKSFRGPGGKEEVTELGHLDCVEGAAIGSVQIDESFEKEATERLEFTSYDENGIDASKIRSTAEYMAKTHFQSIKMNFGKDDVETLPEIALRVPGLRQSYSNPDARIREGRMIFSLDEITDMFDKQVREIFKLIDRQLQNLEDRDPSEEVSHFVISGGLGSSRYVQDRIKQRYEYHQNGKGIKILISTDPQLAVCKGLVLDRVFRQNYEIAILPTAHCSASYGIIVNELYDKKKHDNQRNLVKRENKIDGKWYAVGQIHWLILKGEAINRHEPVSHMFRRITNIDTPEITWNDAVAISKLDRARLPSSIYEGDAKKLCGITSTLNVGQIQHNTEDMRKKRKHFLKPRSEYFEIQQKVLVNIGSVDLRFAVQFRETVIGTQDAIPVRWMHMDNHRGREDDLQEGHQVNNVDDNWYRGLFTN